MIGDYIRPLPLPGDSPEPLSGKPPFLSRSGSSRCRFESDVSPAPGRGPACEEEGGSGRSLSWGGAHECSRSRSHLPFGPVPMLGLALTPMVVAAVREHLGRVLVLC